MKRQWVDLTPLPPAVVASKQRPDLFLRPAEMDLANFYLSQGEVNSA